MSSESHFELPDSYPKKPIWAAILALCFGPFGTAYTSVVLSFIHAVVVLLLINLNVKFKINTVVASVILSCTFGFLAYRYVDQLPKLRYASWLARIDRPGWVRSILLIFTEALVLFGFVFFVRTTVSISGVSMLPTIAPRERVVLNIMPIFRGPVVRGTVVRYQVPGELVQRISRVVALEGDTVKMKRGLLYVNNEAADSPSLVSKLQAAGCIDEKMASSNAAVAGNSPEYPDEKLELRVPKGQMFLLSDNRAVPVEDSRYFGTIPLSTISGVVQLNKYADRHFTLEDCHPSSYGY